jgi:RHH-type proline utilization regulon transcriptional repressor/proline dehydrogenase/delta 1-pyrroline-5-carboxylate dehydrogenase
MFAEAVERMRQSLPRQVPVMVDGRKVEGRQVVNRENPSDTKQIVARVSYATPEDAHAAVKSARAAYQTWRDTPLRDRAMMLEKLADRLEADRFELAALQSLEVG